jgi:hypothetical protein
VYVVTLFSIMAPLISRPFRDTFSNIVLVSRQRLACGSWLLDRRGLIYP